MRTRYANELQLVLPKHETQVLVVLSRHTAIQETTIIGAARVASTELPRAYCSDISARIASLFPLGLSGTQKLAPAVTQYAAYGQGLSAGHHDLSGFAAAARPLDI